MLVQHCQSQLAATTISVLRAFPSGLAAAVAQELESHRDGAIRTQFKSESGAAVTGPMCRQH